MALSIVGIKRNILVEIICKVIQNFKEAMPDLKKQLDNYNSQTEKPMANLRSL